MSNEPWAAIQNNVDARLAEMGITPGDPPVFVGLSARRSS